MATKKLRQQTQVFRNTAWLGARLLRGRWAPGGRRVRLPWIAVVCGVLLAVGCSDGSSRPSADGAADAAGLDAARPDAGPGPDSFVTADVGRVDVNLPDKSLPDQAKPMKPWVASVGGTSFSKGTGIALDSAGNSLVVGWFTKTAWFGTTKLTTGSESAFVAKLDRAGAWQWAVSRSGIYRILGIDVDGSNNSTIVGVCSGAVSIGKTTMSCGGTYPYRFSLFVARLDNSGKIVWGTATSGIARNYSNYDAAIAVDSAGISTVTAELESGSVSFGSTTISGSRGVFVSRLDNSGKVLWGTTTGGTGIGGGAGIAMDSAGNSTVTGWIMGQAIFGSTTLSASGPYEDAFVAKLDNKGKFLWATPAGGAQVSITGYDVGLDGKGNSVVTGWFSGPGSAFGTTTLSSVDGRDVFVVKLDTRGKYSWARRAGGKMGQGGRGVAVDSAGNSTITGYFAGSEPTNFGSITLTGAGTSAVFVARLDSTGKFVWASAASGTDHLESIDIVLDPLGNSTIVGHFDGTAIFGSTTLSSPAKYNFDVFVARLDSKGNF